MPRAHALEDDFRAVIDAVLGARGYPTTRDVGALGRAVAALSAVYNDTSAAAVRAGGDDALAARLGFSFVRDVPKGEAATSELVALDALPVEEERLTVLDLGAGLGAMTWGLARALDRAGRTLTLEADLVDRDVGALAVAQRVFHERSHAGGVRIEARLTPGSAALGAARGKRYGVILLGQVLSELDRERPDDERLARHADLLAALVNGALAPGGALVVVEPALRERTRHLHRVRDALLSSARAHVFAPCTHEGGCPALEVPTDWCHEDLTVDLPAWLVPVARAAGLRYQGLTFSYLVLRADARSVAELAPLRVIASPRVTKGQCEAVLCGRFADGARGQCRATRLDRDRRDENATWDDLARGDLVTVEPELTVVKARLASDSRVKKVDARGPRR